MIHIYELYKSSKSFRAWSYIQVILVMYLLILCIGPKKNVKLSADEIHSSIREYDVEENRKAIEIDDILLKSGSYRIDISFLIDDSITSPDDLAGTVFFEDTDSEPGLRADIIHLNNGYNSVSSDINLLAYIRTHNISIKGVLPKNYTITNISINENVVYRYTRLFSLLVLVLIVDYLWLYYAKNLNNPQYRERLILLFAFGIICVLASIPALSGSKSYGHDFNFHMMRIISIAEEIKNGNLFPRVYLSANNGYGYASPLFYCDFFLYFPALLYILKIPTLICYNSYVVFINLLTVIFAGALFSEIFKDKHIIYVIIGTSLYTLSIYRIMDIYTRDALGEYTAMAFLPLVCLGLIRVYRTKECKITEGLILSLGVSGIVLCHLLSTVIVGMVILVFMILHIKKTLNTKRLLCLLSSFLMTIGMCIWFLYPLVDSYFNMNLLIKGDKDWHIQSHGIYLSNLFSLYNQVMGVSSKLTSYEDEPLTIGGAMIIGIIVAVFVLLFINNEKKEREYNDILKESLIVSFILLIISSSICPWDTLVKFLPYTKLLLIIQYPWRYLSIAVLTGSIATTIAFYLLVSAENEQYSSKYATSVLCVEVIVLMLGIGYYYSDYSNNILTERNYERQYPDNRICVSEYVINNKNDMLSVEEIWKNEKKYMEHMHYEFSDEINMAVIGTDSKAYEVKNYSDSIQRIVLPIISYDNYHAIDTNTGDEIEIVSSDYKNNYLTIEIPPLYFGNIVIRYKTPIIWKICTIISCVFVVFVLGIIRSKIKDGDQKEASKY